MNKYILVIKNEAHVMDQVSLTDLLITKLGYGITKPGCGISFKPTTTNLEKSTSIYEVTSEEDDLTNPLNIWMNDDKGPAPYPTGALLFWNTI